MERVSIACLCLSRLCFQRTLYGCPQEGALLLLQQLGDALQPMPTACRAPS